MDLSSESDDVQLELYCGQLQSCSSWITGGGGLNQHSSYIETQKTADVGILSKSLDILCYSSCTHIFCPAEETLGLMHSQSSHSVALQTCSAGHPYDYFGNDLVDRRSSLHLKDPGLPSKQIRL